MRYMDAELRMFYSEHGKHGKGRSVISADFKNVGDNTCFENSMNISFRERVV